MAGRKNKNLENIFKGDVHHAYLLEGDAVHIVPEMLQLLEKELGIKTAGNPDFWHLRFDALTIDDARNLRENQANKSFGTTARKIFLIETAAVTAEAQNALLKILEEPTTGTHFFLIMPSRWLLLPTVRSRLQLVTVVGESENTSGTAVSFLAATPAERLVMLAPILDEKDKSAALALVDGIIAHIHTIESPHRSLILKELLHARQYLNDRAASLKLILEHLALTIPPLMPVL